MTDQDLPDRIFIAPDCTWNADPIEPCMTEYVSAAEYYKAKRKPVNNPTYELDIGAIMQAIIERGYTRLEFFNWANLTMNLVQDRQTTPIVCILDGVPGEGTTEAEAACHASLKAWKETQ